MSKLQEDPRIIQAKLEKLARLLDSSIALPGGYRIGLEGLIGLLPGIGGAIGAVLSSFILTQAARLGVPSSTLLIMAFNIGIDAVVGLVPLVGDLFDFAWKANSRNVKLLSAYLDNPRKTTKTSRLGVAVILAGVLALIVGVIVLATMLVSAIWQIFN